MTRTRTMNATRPRWLLLLGFLVGCTSNQIRITDDGVADSGVLPDSAMVIADAVPIDAPPTADHALAKCIPNEVSVTLDRSQYTLEQAANVSVTICNGLAEELFLGGCFSPQRFYIEGDVWVAQGTVVDCFWEGIGVAIPPGTSRIVSTIFSSVGVWKAGADYAMGCRKDEPLSTAGCTSSHLSTSSPVLVTAPLPANACTTEQACASGGNMICLSPTDCAPVGAEQMDECSTDQECLFGTNVSDKVCVPECGRMVCRAGCKSDGDCVAGESCLSNGHCAATPCGIEADCPLNFGCDSGFCARQGCTKDSQCWGHCVGGQCHSQPGQCMDCCPP